MILKLEDGKGNVIARYMVDGVITYHEERPLPQEEGLKPTVIISPPETIVLSAERWEKVKDI